MNISNFMAIDDADSAQQSPHIQAVKVVRPKPGDVLLIESPQRVSQEELAYLDRDIRRVFPDHKCLVLDGGKTMTVIGTPQKTSREGDADGC